MLATLVPTILMLGLGILLLMLGSGTEAIVIGVLVLAFCTSSLTGYILGSIFVSRGASVARFQNDFLSSVSHELRTPLTSIHMFIDTLLDERLTDETEQKKCMDLLKREIGRLEGLVERLMNLSRIEAGRYEFHKEPVDLSDVVSQAVTALDAVALGRPAGLEVTVGKQLYTLGDCDALAQAIGNLLVNAWKYTPEANRRIVLRTEASDGHIDVVVADNGPGIPRGEQRRIFYQFERGRAAIDSKAKGSGLGLAITRAIVSAHGGRVDLRSRAGEGSEFRIRLRRIEGPA
jgi:two-component system phosphate regulon sensor histidine kinase PhoR